MASSVFTHNHFSPPHSPVQTQPLKQSNMSSDQFVRQQSRSKSAKTPPVLRKVSSTRYAIGYRAPSKRGKSKSALQQPLLEHEDAESQGKEPLCNLRQDLISTKKMILGSWINLLLIFAPLGIISKAVDWSPSVTFFLNFLGMIPLASILGDATEALAEHLGEVKSYLIRKHIFECVLI